MTNPSERYNGPEVPTTRELRQNLAGLAMDASMAPDQQTLFAQAAKRLNVLEDLATLLGNLAPGGTAPRTALEEIYRQARAGNTDISPTVLDLQAMLAQHYGEWTPALSKIEGFPPKEEDPESATREQ